MKFWVSLFGAALMLGGCASRRLAPGEEYDLGICRNERIEITNEGPGDIKVKASTLEPRKNPVLSDLLTRPGQKQVYTCGGGWLDADGLREIAITITNVSGEETTVIVDRESIGLREIDRITGGSGASPRTR